MTYEEICDYIYRIPKFSKKNGLDHSRELMRRLGNPQLHFEVIHVAGSNGKGSVCAYMNRVLCEAKIPVGLFTSPHLVCMEERFIINGCNCTREDFTEAFLQVREVVGEMQQEGFAHPAFFEYLFAMGMLIFAKYRLRYVIFETGLGGRLDVTNIIEEPLMTIITSISLEHTEYLGSTIAEIAAEKAGIIKEGVPVVFDADNEEACAVILACAVRNRAPYYKVNSKNLKILERTAKSIDFSIFTGYDEVNLRVSSPALYQVKNAALAYRALAMLRTEIGYYPADIVAGIEKTTWPGRMQQVQPGVYFDGAHNAAGMEAFLDTVRVIGGEHPKLLFSMVSDKDYQTAVHTLACGYDWGEIVITHIPDARGLDPQRLADEFEKYGRMTKIIEDCREAYKYAAGRRSGEQKLFCAGSLYLIGELERIAGGIDDD